jgi:hypothetical protein
MGMTDSGCFANCCTSSEILLAKGSADVDPPWSSCCISGTAFNVCKEAFM